VLVPDAPVVSCPIEASLGIFGKKWTLLILRDIGMRKKERFNELLKSIPGISPRVLSRRLRELESSGLVSRNASSVSEDSVRWKITEKGWDALPILFGYIAFGSKWYPEVVFADGQPRTVTQQYPSRLVESFFVDLEVEKRRRGGRPAAGTAKW
jgi:DNA-binding HxlR family transcriptional regulator